jgi:L-seryl-tRNA(Ser) seleniumtransferase
MDICERYGLKRVLNAIGAPTIVGANVAAPEVAAAACEGLGVNVEIDELQRAACRVIARTTGAEAGCVTSSAASGLAITAAAAMTGPDLDRITRLPDASGLRDEVILQAGHDINFGARISQMVRLSGARVISIGTANHADTFHLRGALSARTAAVLYVVNGAVPLNGDFLPLPACVETAARVDVPVIVDAAAEPDVRPFLAAGAALVITSGHKHMGAPTSGLICGRKDLVRACYLQNWGIGRAMKVGKEGIFGLMAALERWSGGDREAAERRCAEIAAIFAERLPVRETARSDRIEIDTGAVSARDMANCLREHDPSIWVNDANDGRLTLDLRVLLPDDARLAAEAIVRLLNNPRPPEEDVPYHDLYWSEQRLLRWPD